MIRPLLLCVAALALATIAGFPIVSVLRAQKVGKAISADGPITHSTKAGTPTMGGIMICGAILMLTLIFDVLGHTEILLPCAAVAIAGAIGFVDDLGSLQGRHQAGLTWRLKLSIISLLSFAVGAILYQPLGLTRVAIPWYGHLALGVLIVPISILVIVCTTSAVAITDGMDGLLAGTGALAFAAYGVIAVAQGQTALASFCFITVGAVLGFLWHNAHPAIVFMGDTGALALGASLSVVALMTEQWIVLPLVGVIFVANAVSDVLQITYFKRTGGRRIFRMAPLHNHFELLGWPETRVVARFWLVGTAGALLGIAAALTV